MRKSSVRLEESTEMREFKQGDEFLEKTDG